MFTLYISNTTLLKMHSKKHRQVRKLRSRPKSRRGRSLKGGAPQPYVYEGTSLTEGNNLIQIAVTRMDDGKYTFNPIGQNFANYCELAKYYCDKKSLACVRQSVTKKLENGNDQTTLFPSWVDLLGIALVLAKKFPTAGPIATDADIRTSLLHATAAINKQTPLFELSATGCVYTFITPAGSFHNISDINEFDMKKILTFIKRMVFYCKYNMMPDQYLDLLTFEKIFHLDSRCGQHVLDTKTFNAYLQNQNYLLNKTQLYALDNLKRAVQASSAAPALAPAQASSAPASPSSADLESRVAKLERDVAALQARQ